jgi:hypothetical protein
MQEAEVPEETAEQLIMVGMEEMAEQVEEVPMAVVEAATEEMEPPGGYQGMVAMVEMAGEHILQWPLPEVAAMGVMEVMH